MKKTKHTLFISLAAATLSVTAASAQAPDLNKPYGYMMRQAEFKISDMYDLSRFSANHGTARSTAMGGAFTSLGADLSSMSINPAGLGMYRTSEFGTTLSLMATRDTSALPGFGNTNGSRTSFAMNNIGAAFNLYEGSGALTSFTFGFNYNKLADFNYRTRVKADQSMMSALDMFEQMVDVYTADVGHEGLGGTTPWMGPDHGGAYTDEWGAVLAYKARLLERLPGSDKYGIVGLGRDANIAHHIDVLSKGGAGEYTISGGWNFSNKFYMGLSLGIIDYSLRREVTLNERYSNNDTDDDLILDRMRYRQNVKILGEGYNLKLGVIYRPLPELRIGVAVHSPSVVSLRTTYYAYMRAVYSNSTLHRNVVSPDYSVTEKFYTPTRVLAGLSYTFADLGIVALDYEYMAYNGMRVYGEEYNGYRDDDNMTDEEWYKNEVKDHFRAAHTARLGVELHPADNLFIRLGGSYTQEGLVKGLMDNEQIMDAPLPRFSYTFSAGLGYRLSPTSTLDLTYVYAHTKYTRYDMYRYDYLDEDEMNVSYHIADLGLSRGRHNLMLALSFRF